MPSTPYVVAATYLSGHKIEVAFSDGVVKGIDFALWLKGPVFEPLKDIEYFKGFILDGWTVSWPNGADIAPETLYHWAGKRESAA